MPVNSGGPKEVGAMRAIVRDKSVFTICNSPYDRSYALENLLHNGIYSLMYAARDLPTRTIVVRSTTLHGSQPAHRPLGLNGKKNSCKPLPTREKGYGSVPSHVGLETAAPGGKSTQQIGVCSCSASSFDPPSQSLLECYPSYRGPPVRISAMSRQVLVLVLGKYGNKSYLQISLLIVISLTEGSTSHQIS